MTLPIPTYVTTLGGGFLEPTKLKPIGQRSSGFGPGIDATWFGGWATDSERRRPER
jgi:hypothetical protein